MYSFHARGATPRRGSPGPIQFRPSNWTIRPVRGGAVPSIPRSGPGLSRPPLGISSSMTVVRLPELNTAVYTLLPSALRARPRRVSPNILRMVAGSPPSWKPGLLASNTQTSARPIPGVVSCGSKGTFWPRCAAVIKAHLSFSPANTISLGSSPTSSVLCRRAGDADTSMMLTLSDR